MPSFSVHLTSAANGDFPLKTLRSPTAGLVCVEDSGHAITVFLGQCRNLFPCQLVPKRANSVTYQQKQTESLQRFV